MSYEMKFTGSYRFADEESLKEAFVLIQQLMEGEDPDLADGFNEEIDEMLMVDGLTVTVAIDTSAPGDDWFFYEGVVETLALLATGGEVIGHHELSEEEGGEVYPAENAE